jgi:hypothetical protein
MVEVEVEISVSKAFAEVFIKQVFVKVQGEVFVGETTSDFELSP